MQAKHFIHWSIVVLCLVHSSKSENTLIDTFNDIYATCLVNLNTDCIQPKALEWFKRVIEKREIQITDDLSILKNDTATITDEESTPEQDSARNNQVNFLSQVDTFLATHYLNIRYPKSVLVDNVPSFMVSTLNRMVPEDCKFHWKKEIQMKVNFCIDFIQKIKFIVFFLSLSFELRSWPCQKSAGSIFAWLKIQNNCFASIGFCFNCIESMESTHTWTHLIGCVNSCRCLQIS